MHKKRAVSTTLVVILAALYTWLSSQFSDLLLKK